MSNETTAGPYTIEARESDPHNQNFFRVVGPHFIGGWLTNAEADYLCRHLNTAYAAGQASREQAAHPQTEDLEAHREELIEMAARFFTEDGVYHPDDNYYIVKRGSLAGDCARIIAGYLMDITPARSLSPSKGVEAPPVSEPVAWMDSGGAVIGAAMKRYKEMSIHIDRRESAKDYTTPLFTHPTKE